VTQQRDAAITLDDCAGRMLVHVCSRVLARLPNRQRVATGKDDAAKGLPQSKRGPRLRSCHLLVMKRNVLQEGTRLKENAGVSMRNGMVDRGQRATQAFVSENLCELRQRGRQT